MFEANKVTVNLVEAEKVMDYLLSQLVITFRCVHSVMLMMVRSPDPSIGTMGVAISSDGRISLKYNPGFVAQLTTAEATYVFHHEVYHLMLHHCTYRRFDNSALGNIATDLAVNELISESSTCLKPRDADGNLVGQFVSEYKKNPQFEDIKEMESAEWYYDYLLKKIGDVKRDDGCAMDMHDGWAENEIVDVKVQEKVREITNKSMWGNTSGGVVEIIRAAQTRKINWRRFIKTFFGNIAWKGRVSTRKKPNRRTGFIHPGYKSLHVSKFLIAIDTSGSTYGLLGEFLSVINKMIEFFPIDVMEFDYSKQSDPRPYKKAKESFNFKGMGGTSFQPVIDIIDEKKYKAVCILTDGEAAEVQPPKNARVLWVLPEGKLPPVSWGDIVHMSKHN